MLHSRISPRQTFFFLGTLRVARMEPSMVKECLTVLSLTRSSLSSPVTMRHKALSFPPSCSDVSFFFLFGCHCITATHLRFTSSLRSFEAKQDWWQCAWTRGTGEPPGEELILREVIDTWCGSATAPWLRRREFFVQFGVLLSLHPTPTSYMCPSPRERQRLKGPFPQPFWNCKSKAELNFGKTQQNNIKGYMKDLLTLLQDVKGWHLWISGSGVLINFFLWKKKNQ